ncbi:MAG TPA: copper resistance protein NlpE [Flavobacterium sp.]|nr:copper resistance protein NlpE [Flavobacterium sp.]
MKKVVIAVSLVFLSLISCQKQAEKDGKSDDTTTVVNDSASSTVSDEHNSQNSLDYLGMYKGVLPCADCNGISTNIILNKDLSYEIITVYLGKREKIHREKGTFTWNKEGNTIILNEIKNAPNQYFVGENTLIQLDMEGKRITGELANKYVLVKLPSFDGGLEAAK